MKMIVVVPLTQIQHRSFTCYTLITLILFICVQVGEGLDYCEWTLPTCTGANAPACVTKTVLTVDGIIDAGDYTVLAPGCKMKKMIRVQVAVTISGIDGAYHELQNDRVDKLGPVGTLTRHFKVETSGKLTLKFLKLTWSEIKTTSRDAGFILLNGGHLIAETVHFYNLDIPLRIEWTFVIASQNIYNCAVGDAVTQGSVAGILKINLSGLSKRVVITAADGATFVADADIVLQCSGSPKTISRGSIDSATSKDGHTNKIGALDIKNGATATVIGSTFEGCVTYIDDSAIYAPPGTTVIIASTTFKTNKANVSICFFC